MRYASLGAFLERGAPVLARGPVAMVFAEDQVEVASTLTHHLQAGFRSLLLFADEAITLPPDLEDQIHRITLNVQQDDALTATVDRITAAAPPETWLYYCYNAEYLFFPFSESRSIRDMLTFHGEERRDAMLTYVIDLYAGDLARCPSAVSRDDTYIDKSGYYALGRPDPARNNHPKERQLDFFGGLRWRFEEHVPAARRKIDRISLFKARPGLRLRPDHTFSDEEYNTYACPWHHNLTAAICSFRAAKALRGNPGSRYEIQDFRWRNSVPFGWNSRQLMDLGLMEPGQWF